VEWTDNEVLAAAHELRHAGDVAGLLHLAIVVMVARAKYEGRHKIMRENGFEPFTIAGGDDR
jgi:hypothetical protein